MYVECWSLWNIRYHFVECTFTCKSTWKCYEMNTCYIVLFCLFQQNKSREHIGDKNDQIYSIYWENQTYSRNIRIKYSVAYEIYRFYVALRPNEKINGKNYSKMTEFVGFFFDCTMYYNNNNVNIPIYSDNTLWTKLNDNNFYYYN